MNKLSFVLGATAHGPMIFSRLDVATFPDGTSYGVGAQLMYRGAYEPEEIAQLKTLLDLRRKRFGEGVIMLDCGANIGVMTVECARHMDGWGHVNAFEPQERIFHALCGNLALNNLLNTRAHMVALGKGLGSWGVPDVNYRMPGSYGSLELDGPNDDLGQDLVGRLLNMVTLRTIDSYDYQRVDVMKIDVEGMEPDLLEGAAVTIARCKPIILIEHSKTGIEKIVDMLGDMNYDCGPCGSMNLLCFHREATYIQRQQIAPLMEAVKLGEAGNTDAGLAIVTSLLDKNPNDQLARFNYATLLMQKNDFENALYHYDMVVIAAENGSSVMAQSVRDVARFGRGFSNLVMGNLKKGFVDFEYRKVAEIPELLRAIPRLTPNDVIEWDCGLGEQPEVISGVKGKTVLVVGEMGFGDNIMFARYLTILVQQGAHVIASVPPQLGSLFARLENVQVLGEHSPRPDMWCPMMSLAYIFGTDIDSVPPPVQFHLDETRIARWKGAVMHLSSPGRLKVGLCWSGSRKSQYDQHRSIPFSELKPLFDIHGVDFFSLQLDVRETDKDAYDRSQIFGMADKFFTFEDTANAMMDMDLVITVDTSVAHLAGSLGIPTWVMLTTFRTYWLWILGREDCPWYPTAKAFRQETSGNWESVVSRVAAELKTFQMAVADSRSGIAPAKELMS